MPRDQIFISYSHDEKRWVDEIKITLAPLTRKGTIVVWDDTNINPGTKWKMEISAALSRARLAILLVSRRFLASEFIASNESPKILEAAQKDGLTIFWIAVGYSLYEHTFVTDYQAANSPERPLNSLSESDLDRELVEIARRLSRAMSLPQSGGGGAEQPSSDSNTLKDPAIEKLLYSFETPTTEHSTGDPVTIITPNKENEPLGFTIELPEIHLPIHRRLRDELADNKWAWRSVHALSGKGGTDEDTTLQILRADPAVELGRSRTGRVIARMRPTHLQEI